MSGKRKAFLILFIIVSLFGMWARYVYEKTKRREREAMLRSLPRLNTTYDPISGKLKVVDSSAPTPTPEERIDEKRDMFDGELPKDSFEQIKQTIGKDFRLMRLSLSEESVNAYLSTDGKEVKSFTKRKNYKGSMVVKNIITDTF